MKQFFEKNKRTNSILLLFVAVCICCTISTAFAKYITTIPVGTFNLTVEGGSPEVFAVYSEDADGKNGCLTFYNRPGKPAEGDTFNEKVATKVYTGFEAFPPKTFYDKFPWYAQRANIKLVEFADEISPDENTGYWFYEMTNLEEIRYLDRLNTSNVTYMENMFYNCSKLEKIDVSCFNTSKVTKMGSMFFGCSLLKTLDLSSFNTSNNQNLNFIFWGCSNLETIYVSENFKIPTKERNSVFKGCNKLKGGNDSTLESVQASGVTANVSISGEYARIDGKDGNKGYFTCAHVIHPSKFVDGICSSCGQSEDGTFDLLEDEETSTIDFDFSGIDDTGLIWKPISDHDNQQPYPNEDYVISFTVKEGFALPEIITVTIDDTAYAVYTDGLEHREGDNLSPMPTFDPASGLLTIPAILLTETTKQISISVTAIESAPEATPIVEPTASPVPTATPEISPTPTVEPTPTATPSAEPSTQPSASPTADPTEEPAVEPTTTPDTNQTPEIEPTAEPMVSPEAEPTTEPTIEPTAEPTVIPTEVPTPEPKDMPSPVAEQTPDTEQPLTE